MILRGSGVIGAGALRLKSSVIDNIKAMSRSPLTSTFCVGDQAAPSRSGGGSNEDGQRRRRQQQQPPVITWDAMSHSFGEGYSTRSEEEGFGGIYGGNQSISEPGENEHHPAYYDKSQGSEVKEKEKSRNQA